MRQSVWPSWKNRSLPGSVGGAVLVMDAVADALAAGALIAVTDATAVFVVGEGAAGVPVGLAGCAPATTGLGCGAGSGVVRSASPKYAPAAPAAITTAAAMPPNSRDFDDFAGGAGRTGAACATTGLVGGLMLNCVGAATAFATAGILKLFAQLGHVTGLPAGIGCTEVNELRQAGQVIF